MIRLVMYASPFMPRNTRPKASAPTSTKKTMHVMCVHSFMTSFSVS